MNNAILAAKVICLFISIVIGFTNIAKLMYKQDVAGANISLMAATMTGFITLQWLI
jgi:hypothetical protein